MTRIRRITALPRTWTLAVLAALAVLALSVGAAAPQPAAAAAPTLDGNLYNFVVDGTPDRIDDAFYAMTVLDQSTADNAPVVTHSVWHGTLSQMWRLVDTGAGGGFYQIINGNSGLCLEMPGEVAPAGTAAQQFRCDPNYKNQPNQLWQLLLSGNGYLLRNKASGLYLLRTDDGRVVQSK